MLLAIPPHLLKSEASVISLHPLIAALSTIVAWGRWRKAPISRHRAKGVTTRSPLTPVCVAGQVAEGERMPIRVHVIDQPDARLQVDSGSTEPIADRLAPLQFDGPDREATRNYETN
jgi:hypothetical protein